MSFPASLPSPPPERSSSISDVEAILNYKFKNPKLLEEALTHPSVQYTPNYERLEFLGDRVVNLVVGDYLFQAYTDLNEGELTDLMKANVSNENLARVALRRGLYPFLRHKMPNSDDQWSEMSSCFPSINCLWSRLSVSKVRGASNQASVIGVVLSDNCFPLCFAK